MKKQIEETFPTVRNYVAKHMNALNVASVEIDKKKEMKSGKEKHKKRNFDNY